MQVQIHKTLGGKNDLFTATVDGYQIADNNSKLPMVIYTRSLQSMYEYLGNIGQNELVITSRRIDKDDPYNNGAGIAHEFVDVYETRH